MPNHNTASQAPGQPLRIVHIVETLNVGGLERLAVDLAVTQRAQGHDVRIFCVCSSGPLAADAEAGGVPVVAFLKAPGLSLGAVFQIARQLRSARAQVVHTHNAIIHHYGAAAARLARVPVVVNTQHGIGGALHSLRQRRIFRSTLRFTDAVVFVSEGARQAFHAQGITPARAPVILNGIRLDRLLAVQAAPGSARPVVRFGTVGRMAAVKDHATLLRAFRLLLDRLPSAELRILGYGQLEQETRELAVSLGIAGQVRFAAGSSDVPSFLSDLDVFVLSSLTEGLPMCVLEAMAAGLPVVSTRVGGVPEAAPEGRVAWYCPPGDPAALAGILRQAALASNLAEMGLAGRALVQEQFGTEIMTAHYQRLYRDLLGGR